MVEINARQTVVDEQQKRAAAQQAASILQGKMEDLQQAQLQMFMANWNNNGLSSVTNATPVTAGDIGHHACRTMSDALSKQGNEFLLAVSEQLTEVSEDVLKSKKDGAYLVALVRAGMKRRCEDLILKWEDEGPKCIGISEMNPTATTQDAADKHMAPLIAKSTKGSYIHRIMRDLQFIDKDKLLHVEHGVYLAALQDRGASGRVL